jgi:transcriptional regulator with XRE-family HTH domain
MQLKPVKRGNTVSVQLCNPALDLMPPEVIDAHVGNRLRARRIDLRMSQAALGRHLGVSFSQVQKYEKGSNRIGAGRLFLIGALLGVPVRYFFEGLAERSATAANASDAAESHRLQEAFGRITDPLTRQALVSLALSLEDV